MAQIDLKRCPNCGHTKPVSDFGTYKDASRNGKIRVQSYCKLCTKNRIREYERAHASYDRTRAKQIKHNYGITIADFDAMLLAQNNRCAICGETFTKTPQVDHDHITGKIRGLLCNECNHILGNSRDSITVLGNAIRYLENNK